MSCVQDTSDGGHADTAAPEEAPEVRVVLDLDDDIVVPVGIPTSTLVDEVEPSVVEGPVVEAVDKEPPREPSVPLDEEDEDPVLGEGLIKLTVPIMRSSL